MTLRYSENVASILKKIRNITEQNQDEYFILLDLVTQMRRMVSRLRLEAKTIYSNQHLAEGLRPMEEKFLHIARHCRLICFPELESP